MTDEIANLITQEISPSSLRRDGHLTNPRSYGVFEIPTSSKSKKIYRYGNYPVRQDELTLEHGRCTLLHLFLDREIAQTLAYHFNKRSA